MSHRCHANACASADVHAELPFCKRHFGMLPEPHRQKMWSGRPKGGCGVCSPYSGERAADWGDLFNLGVAIILIVESSFELNDDHVDDTGFCWRSGLQRARKTIATAKLVIQKFEIRGDVEHART